MSNHLLLKIFLDHKKRYKNGGSLGEGYREGEARSLLEEILEAFR